MGSNQEILERAISWAKEAGRIQLSYFRGSNLGISTKSNAADVVTKVDKECEAYILGEIQKHYPTHAILGEETGTHSGTSDYLWVIDPLDGTNNFSQGLPIFAVSIGLQHNGTTILGVIYIPYLDELYTSIKGSGAYCNGKEIHIANKTELKYSVLGTGFPYDKDTNPDNNVSNVARILPKIRGLRRMGAAAYDLACVASGTLDAYWEFSLGAWDMCAGALLVEEAGGHILHFRENRGISIIAGNVALVNTIKDIVE